MELRKFVCPEIFFGEGARLHIANYLMHFQVRKPLIVTDSVVSSQFWFSEIRQTLKEASISYVTFIDVSPNPRNFQVMKGADVYLSSNCDCIVAIGGGSVIDCAKGIGIVASNDLHINNFEGVDNVALPMPPLFCIGTTSGSAADVSQFAIINRQEDKVKFAIISKAVVPDVALIDPIPLLTMDKQLSAATGIDALVHAIEAYVSTGASHLTDTHALNAIELLAKHLLSSIEVPDNLELRNHMMHACFYAGLAFSNASLGAVHAMAHSLGGLLDLPHGECNAMLLPHVSDFNYESNKRRFDQIAQLLAGSSAQMNRKDSFEIIREFVQKAGITTTLKDFGVGNSTVKQLSRNAFVDPCNATNPREPSLVDIETIYKEAI